MSEHDPNHDPIDKAYREAEALLDDAEARAARRASLLAAVAEEAAPPIAEKRRSPWTRVGWLAAASVAGVGLFLASQPPLFNRFQVQTAAPGAGSSSPTTTTAPQTPSGVQIASSASQASGAGGVTSSSSPSPSRRAAAPPAPAKAPSLVASTPPVALAPEGPAPPAPAFAPPPQNQPPAAAAGPAEVSEVVATGSYIRGAPEDASIPVQVTTRADVASSAPSALSANVRNSGSGRPAALPNDAPARLRAAAAAGRTAEVEALLAQGALVDAPDDGGNTALMESVQANHPDVAALLRRRGARLDVKNHAGQSALDMAAVLGDAKLNQALGLPAPILPRRVD